MMLAALMMGHHLSISAFCRVRRHARAATLAGRQGLPSFGPTQPAAGPFFLSRLH
jgi:hypothetical protein